MLLSIINSWTSIIVFIMFMISILILSTMSGKSEQAKGKILKDDHYYVTAKSGLILRKSSSIKSEKLLIIPYLTILKTAEKSYKYDTINNITACWHSVKYQDTEGWVFSGYLSAVYPEYLEKQKTKKCNYKESIFENSICYSGKIEIIPFKKNIEGKIPCYLENINLEPDLRKVRLSKSGRWLVVTDGTWVIGNLAIYDLNTNTKLYRSDHTSIKFTSDGSFIFKKPDRIDCNRSELIEFKISIDFNLLFILNSDFSH